MSIDAMKQALADAQRDERHLTVAETRYWCNQYKLLAQQAITALRAAIDQAQEPAACQYAKDVSMPEYRCAVKCQYAQPAQHPPRFPTMLRKMWSGGEVQQWIDENWGKHEH